MSQSVRETSVQLLPLLLSGELEQKDVYAVLELEDSVRPDAASNYVMISVLNFPATMIIQDILCFLLPALTDIVIFRLFRQYLHHDQYLAILLFESAASAQSFLSYFNNRAFTSFQREKCLLQVVAGVSIQTPTGHHPVTNTEILTADMNSTSFLRLFDGISDLSSASASASPGDGMIDRSSPSPRLKENCTLCLEPLQPTTEQSTCIAILYCGHRFHAACLAKLRGSQCPVCRFEHLPTRRGGAATCSICAAQQPALADHNINYCISTADLSLGEIIATRKSLHSIVDSVIFDVSNPPRLWLCLVCGVTACGENTCAHHIQHYQSTLHAYAMDVRSGRVWDYSREAFVHRLALNPSSTSIPSISTSSSITTETVKYLDVTGPILPEQREEEQVLGGKLDALLKQYCETLNWRLQAAREQHELQVQRVWSAAGQQQPTSTLDDANSSSSGDGSSLFWLRQLKLSLTAEQLKLNKQCEILKDKIALSQQEAEISLEMERQLCQNIVELEARVKAAEQHAAETQATFSRQIMPLQAKVEALMARLEEPSPATSSSSRAVPMTPPSSSSIPRRTGSSSGGGRKKKGG